MNRMLMKKGSILKSVFGVVFIYMLVKPLVDQDKYSAVTPDEDKSIGLDDKDLIEQPLHDVILPRFSEITDVKQKKTQFFNFLRPAIQKENARISQLREDIESLSLKFDQTRTLSTAETKLINHLIKQYKIKNISTNEEKLAALLNRIDIVPTPLVLVQAANESAWGTSRFARIGLNFFGIWCFKEGCGMVPKGRDVGLRHEVAAFSSVENSVKHYLHNINTNHAYHVFRIIREQLHEQNQPLTAEILATGLLPYSERGTDYVLEISEMIRHNQKYFQ
jgi:Bax protein